MLADEASFDPVYHGASVDSMLKKHEKVNRKVCDFLLLYHLAAVAEHICGRDAERLLGHQVVEGGVFFEALPAFYFNRQGHAIGLNQEIHFATFLGVVIVD